MEGNLFNESWNLNFADKPGFQIYAIIELVIQCRGTKRRLLSLAVPGGYAVVTWLHFLSIEANMAVRVIHVSAFALNAQICIWAGSISKIVVLDRCMPSSVMCDSLLELQY